MGIRDILLHMEGAERDAARFAVAAELATRFDAHLVGLHVVNPYVPVAIGGPGAAGMAELQRHYMDSMRDRAGETEKAFAEMTGGAGVPSEWRFAEGDIADTVAQHARYADIAIIGQSGDDSGASLPAELSAEVALAAGVPVLTVPYVGTFETVGRRVLVAWNGSREAVRAVHDAMPLLTTAETVIVLSVEPWRKDALAGADIGAHLARHGVNVEAKRTAGDDIGVSDMLLNAVSDLGADMIVMGAYGHSRFRELVLGGVTHQLLGSMTVPVLLSH